MPRDGVNFGPAADVPPGPSRARAARGLHGSEGLARVAGPGPPCPVPSGRARSRDHRGPGRRRDRGPGPVPADVAVDGDTIVAVGPEVDGPATRTLDADGAPRHPRASSTSTPTSTPSSAGTRSATSSCWHGVTSVVLGNCGVTFAPVRPGDREYLARMMESVEDIPAAQHPRRPARGRGRPTATTSRWLDGVPKGVNVGGMVGHCAVRYHAMGDRSLDEGAGPTDDELAAMVALVDEAMGAGALGFSTSRTRRHIAPDGRNVPGHLGRRAELVALAEVLGRHGRGVFGSAPRFDGEGPGLERARSEVALMAAMSRASGRPFTFNLTNTFADPELWRQTLAFVAEANAAGARLRPQTTSRGHRRDLRARPRHAVRPPARVGGSASLRLPEFSRKISCTRLRPVNVCAAISSLLSDRRGPGTTFRKAAIHRDHQDRRRGSAFIRFGTRPNRRISAAARQKYERFRTTSPGIAGL